MQSEQQPLTPDAILNAINHCIDAYREVRAKLPPNAGHATRNENHHAGCAAYLTKLPILCDPASFHIYIACIAHGASLGIIDPVDIGRFCHVAQIAMSAWKLANLTVPAAQKKEEREAQKHATPLPSKGNHPADEDEREAARDAQKQPQDTHPLPPKGNHFEDEEERDAARRLPDIKTQNQLYKELRERGIPVPAEKSLRDNPLVALYFCDMAANHLDSLPPRRDNPDPEPDSEPIEQPDQAA